jgi:hypothetical protein
VCRKDGSGTYQSVISFSEIPFCKILSGMKFLLIFDMIINSVLEIAEEFSEVCSRKGAFKAMNISFLDSSFVSQFPAGDYRVNLQIFDSKDENIFNITVHSTIVQ